MQSGMASILIPCTLILSATDSRRIFWLAAAISLYWRIFSGMSIETTRIYLTRSSKEQKLLLDKMVTW